MGLGIALLGTTVLASLRVFLHGDELGDFVADLLNHKMRGRIEVGTIEWPMSAIPTAIRGGWVPVTARDVRVWDDCMQSTEGRARRTGGGGATTSPFFIADLPCSPDDRRVDGLTPRRKLLETAKVTAEIDIHALFFGNHDLVFRNIRVDGGEVLIEQSAEPYPLHDYDKTTISLVSAFQPRMKAGFRSGIFADKPPPIFDLRDVHLSGIGVNYHQRPEFRSDGTARYPVTLRVENVAVDAGPTPSNRAFLYSDGSDPLVGKFYLSITVIGGPGRLRIDDEGRAEDFQIGPVRADRRVARYIIDLASVDVQRLAQLPRHWLDGDPIARTLELRLTARTVQGGVIDVSGELKDYWDRPFSGTWALDVSGKNLGPTVTSSIMPSLSGRDVSAELRLRGPFIANPRIEYQLAGLEYETLTPKEIDDPPPLRLSLARLKGELDLVNDQGHLDETIAQVLSDDGQLSHGKLRIDATFGLKPYQINNADIHILEAIDLGRFLPDAARRHLGRFVRGSFSGNGDTISGFALRNLDLVIGQRPSEVTARLYGGRVFTTDNFSTLEVAREQPLHARIGETTATISGSVLARTRWLKLKLGNVQSPDLGRWLRRIGVFAMASSASDGQVEIVGPVTAPAIDATATLAGVPVIGQASVATHFEDQLLDIRSAETTTMGGSVSAAGRIRIAGTPFVESLTVRGQSVSAERVASALGWPGKTSGTINAIDLTVSGSLATRADPIDWIDLIDGYVQADRITLAGDQYNEMGLCVSRSRSSSPLCRRRDATLADADQARCDEARRKGGTCVIAHATRQGGGDLDLQLAKTPLPSGTAGAKDSSQLSGAIDISSLPLRIFDRLAGNGTFGGTIATRMTLGGTTLAPTASGSIEILRGWAKGAFFGDSRLTVTPGLDSSQRRALSITGSALAGRLTLVATVGTVAPYLVELRISGQRIELEPLLDDHVLAMLPFPVRVWASGSVRLRAELAPRISSSTAREAEAWIELTELEAIGDYRDGDVLSPLRIAARPMAATAQGRRPAISIRMTPSSVEFACAAVDVATPTVPCPVQLETPAGVITLSGAATSEEIKLVAEGSLDLSRLSSLLAQQFDELSGSVSLRASLGGTVALPVPAIAIEFDKVSARPTGSETVVKIPGGRIGLQQNSIGFTGVRMTVDDTHLLEGGELTIGGNIKLTDWRPSNWGVIIDGKIAGKMLLALAPQAISQASGVAEIEESIQLQGKGLLPSISTRLRFEPTRPLTLIPRGFRREFAFRDGGIEIKTSAQGGVDRYKVTLEEVTATLDGGMFRHIQGGLELCVFDQRCGRPVVSADVQFDVDTIPFGSPGSLDLLLTGSDLRLRLPKAGAAWRVDGNIEVVNGKYIQNFEFGELLRPTTPKAGRNRPFWEEWPEIGNADLDLKVRVLKFAVDNNIASIDLNGNVTVTGTPRDPAIGGQISVQQGTVAIPGLRAKFNRTKGTVDFNPSQRFWQQTPSLDLESEADYRDPTGRDHLITLTLRGTPNQILWDLRTSTGYNKTQTMALIFLGKTPDQVRQSIGDGALGSDPTRIDPTTNPSTGAADQLIKDLAGNWVSLLLGNSLEELTGLDVLRFQFDFGSIGLRGEKKLTENLSGVFELEQTGRGSSVSVSGNLRTPLSRLTLQGEYLNKNFDSEAEQDIQALQLKLVYRFFIP